MGDNDIETFEQCWKKFMIRVKGKMMRHAQKQELTYSLLQLILKDASYSWNSNAEENGRWLMKYAEKNPQGGALIRQILLDDMAFTEISEKQENWEMLANAVPVAGAATGYGISSILGTGPVVKAIFTIVPAFLLYPAAKELGESVKNRGAEGYVDKYLGQLDKFKKSVISVLQDKSMP